MRTVLAVCAVACAAVLLAMATPAVAATSCPSFTTHGYRFTTVKGYSLPCDLGRAAVAAWAKTGFSDNGPKSFKWHGGKASFLCYFNGRSNGPGKCKGGVKKNGRMYPYGTVDWQKRRAT